MAAAADVVLLAVRLSSIGKRELPPHIASGSSRLSLALWPVQADGVAAGPQPIAPPSAVDVVGLTVRDLQTRSGFIGDPITITWQYGGAYDAFDVDIEHVENRIVTHLLAPTTEVEWTPMRAGHYHVRVRARHGSAVSDWATSQTAGWWLFFWLKPPGFP